MGTTNPPTPPTPTAPTTPSLAPAPLKFTVGSTVVPSSSAEVAFPLREEQFQTLCEGEMNSDRSGRDVCIGLFIGALIGFVGILAATDWTVVWVTSDRRRPLIWSLGILFFIAAGSLVGIIVCWIRLWRTHKNSSYSRLKRRIEDFFTGQKTSQGQ